MSEDFNFIGDFTPTELEQSGITIVAPGLYGSGTWHAERPAGALRAFTGERSELDRAITESGAEDRHTLLIDAPTPLVTGGGVRSSGDVADDELLLQVPLANDEAAFVLYLDEAGIVSFHYQETRATTALPTRAFGAGQQALFRLRLRTGVSRRPGETRALFSRLASKLIKVLVVKVFPDALGAFAARRVRAWEHRYRPFAGFHGGTWEQILDPTPTAVDDLARFAGHRSLLLLHGTTSSTAGAFAGLNQSPALLEQLRTRYEGRVLGFNHHTMSVAVADNVRQFHVALAAAPGDYAFDVVCHSRGGLLARALAHLSDDAVGALTGTPWQRPTGVRVTIGRIVFVATPNAGTALADPQGIPGLVERLTNYVNMLPDATLTIASGALLSLAGAAAEVALPRLPGLADQAPESPLQQLLAPPPGDAERFYAFCADYEPENDLVGVVKHATMDRIFAAEDNDLVVPTKGVAHTPYFDVPAEHTVVFESERRVHHCAFFEQPEVARIGEWLAVG